jgi:hypothetical protein
MRALVMGEPAWERAPEEWLLRSEAVQRPKFVFRVISPKIWSVSLMGVNVMEPYV